MPGCFVHNVRSPSTVESQFPVRLLQVFVQLFAKAQVHPRDCCQQQSNFAEPHYTYLSSQSTSANNEPANSALVNSSQGKVSQKRHGVTRGGHRGGNRVVGYFAEGRGFNSLRQLHSFGYS
jgi:hypothetical protein